jgi:hypothetical protein
MTHPLLVWLEERIAEWAKIAEDARHGMPGVWEWQCNHMDYDGNLVHPLQPSHDLCAKLDCDEITIYDEGGHSPEQARHIAYNDPRSVLAVVEAHRTLLGLHAGNRSNVCETCSDTEILAASDSGGAAWPCPTVRALASAYRHAPGWDEAWGPT